MQKVGGSGDPSSPQGPQPIQRPPAAPPGEDFKTVSGGGTGTLSDFLGSSGIKVLMNNLIKSSIDQIKHDTDEMKKHSAEDRKRAEGEG